MRHIRRGGWQLLPSPQCPSREGSRYSCEGQGLLVANPRPTQASPGPILPFGRTLGGAAVSLMAILLAGNGTLPNPPVGDGGSPPEGLTPVRSGSWLPHQATAPPRGSGSSHRGPRWVSRLGSW